MTKEEWIQNFESAVLGVMDDCVREALDASGYGWEDGDLDVFLNSIRRHAETLFHRYETE